MLNKHMLGFITFFKRFVAPKNVMITQLDRPTLSLLV